MMASARDYECPICMLLMIEPVMLPCKHELCYKCFMMSYTNTSDQCPFCRVRIATWARKAMRTNRVINTKKWNLIKKLFPERVKCIFDGKDVTSDEEETEMQIISEAGSLGKEYMAELEKIESERLQASQEEEAASLALIKELFETEGLPFTLSSGETDSTSSSSHFAAAVKPNDRTCSVIDEERFKQIEEEEAASLRLIRQIQEEEEQIMRERQKREELDQQYARMIASELNKPLLTEPVIDPSDCIICPSSPCSFTSMSSVDASFPTSLSCASSLPVTPSTLCTELPTSFAHMSTEAGDKVVTPNSVLHKSEMNIKGKKSAAATPLTKWLKFSRLPAEAALGSSSESGMPVLDLQLATDLVDQVLTDPPTQMNATTEELCTVARPSVTSEQDNLCEGSATVAKPNLANNEQTFVLPAFSSSVSEETVDYVFASEVGHDFGLDVAEVVCELNKLHSEATAESNSAENHSDSSGRPNDSRANDKITTRSFSQNSGLTPTVSGSEVIEPKQCSIKHSETVNAICNASGILGNPPIGATSPIIPAASAQGRKSCRNRHSAGLVRPARKSLKRSANHLTEDPEPCCSTSKMSPTACQSILPDSSCGPAKKKMFLKWSEASSSFSKISEVSEAFADNPPLTGSDFYSEESYRLYLEEHDHQLALRLQRKFDLESKSKIIPRSDESAH